jgi:hypothetical protein
LPAIISLSGLLLVIAVSACGLRQSDLPEPDQHFIGFENASDATVRVYLIGAGQDWLLGRVGPGRGELLRIPVGFPTYAAGSVSLVIVPTGVPGLVGAGVAQMPGAIQSGPYQMGDLLGMRWSLKDQFLLANPLGVRER